jgi:quercetin dioxygenase-like cupin family protein
MAATPRLRTNCSRRKALLQHEDMSCSRRDFGLFLPLLTAAVADAKDEVLPSSTLKFEDMPVKQNGANIARQILSGATHSGYHFDIHMTELGPGEAPHPPHRHIHEEMIMIQVGTMEVTINGKSTTLGPGSVAYVASNDHHGWRNVGHDRSRYFVLALGQDA